MRSETETPAEMPGPLVQVACKDRACVERANFQLGLQILQAKLNDCTALHRKHDYVMSYLGHK
jgi:hypothetical protein